MEISQTPPPETSIEIITPASPGLRTPPEKKADKRDREKNRERKDSGKKRSRKELEDPRQRRDASRKGKEAHEPARADDEVTVVGERNLRDAAKSMPRIPKLSQQRDSSTAAGAGPRDPRLSMQKHGHGECHLTGASFLSVSRHAGHRSDAKLAEHNGGGGGGNKKSTGASEDDVQVLAAYPRRSRHSKRSHSPGHQGFFNVPNDTNPTSQ